MPRNMTLKYRNSNDLQNKSYLSEKNVICQDRKLRGRILKPIEARRPRRYFKKVKNVSSTHYISEVGEQNHMDAIVSQQNNVCDEKFEGVVAHSNGQSQTVLLYKTIKRLWHENLQVFIYHSDSVDFSNFIYSFPDLIAVQIKIVLPSSFESEICQIISSKNFIFQKNAFLKMIDSTRLDTSTTNIMFMVHSPNNEEPRTVRLSPIRPIINMELDNSPNEIIKINEDNDQPKALDLRTTFSHGLESNNGLNRNIVNRLQRLNTVIRRLPDKTIPKYCVSYRRPCLPQLYSSQVNFNVRKHFKRKGRWGDVMKSPEYRNCQRDCAYDNKLVKYVDSYQKPLINTTPSLFHKNDNPRIILNNIKTEMWISYTTSVESFDRDVSLDELDAMPIASLFNPGEDFNIDDYL